MDLMIHWIQYKDILLIDATPLFANHHYNRVYTVDSKYVWIRREQKLRDEQIENRSLAFSSSY